MFLVRHNKNMQEADSLTNYILKIKPDNQMALWVKGLILYKRSEYRKALNFLEQAYSQDLVWRLPLFYDIKMAKEAAAKQNN